MKRFYFLIILALLDLHSFSVTNCADKAHTIDSLMKSHIVPRGKNPVYNFLIYAASYKDECVVHLGTGTVGRNQIKIDPDYQFNVASITKTMVATVILQLEEEGKLKTSDFAAVYLNDIDFLKFTKFHYFRKFPYADSITIKMLLNHTSGIADVFTDASLRFNLSVLLHKKRQYTPEKLINRYFRFHLNRKAFNRPGYGYHYSDINYMLLGFIIQKVTGRELPQAIRERIITPLGMTNTYFEYYEPPHGNLKRIDAFLKKMNMTERINTSYEWAGGGIVSSTRDLAVFISSLLDGRLFRNQSVIEKMKDVADTRKFGASYGLGLIRYEIDGQIYYGHGGFYGSLMVYNPTGRIVLCANIGQAIPPYDSGELAKELIRVISL
jgi:D-alanyl-D-alanine carboxypeptidase